MFPPVAARRTPRHTFEDAVELRVAAEAGLKRGFQHGQPLPGSINPQKLFHALAVAEIHQRDPSLLLKQAAQTMRAQAGTPGEFVETEQVAFVADEASGLF